MLAIILTLPIIAFAQNPPFDLDIPDNMGNLVGNTMTMNIGLPPTYAGFGTGDFWVVNTDLFNNPDPDLFGNVNTGPMPITFYAYDLVSTTNFLAYIPYTNVSFNFPSGVLLWGQGQLAELSVTIPSTQEEGIYEGWVVAAAPPISPQFADSFLLRVIVGSQEDVDIVEDYISSNATAFDTLTYVGTFTILNPTAAWNPDPDDPGNIDLYNLRFSVQNLIDTVNPGYYISSDNVYLAITGVFGPTPYTSASIGQLTLGDTAFVDVWIGLPLGTRAGNYQGQIQVQDDDGWPSDVGGIYLEVDPSYDLDISDNTGNLVENWMTMNIAPPPSGSGYGTAYFMAINPNNPDLNVDPDPYGNADLDNIAYAVDDLVHISNPLQYMPSSVVSLSITPYWSLATGASDMVSVSVLVPPSQFEGEYTTWVRLLDTLTAPGWVGDSFQLRVVVGPEEDIDIVESDIYNTTGVGDTLVFIDRFTVINPDPSWNPDPDGPSNSDLYNLRFAAQNMLDTIQPTKFIPSEQVYIAVTGVFGPTPVSQASIGQITLGDTAIVEVWAYLPYGTKVGTYKGQVQIQDDDGWPSDVIGVWLNVDPYYDLDISDNTGNLVENWMTMSIASPLSGASGVGTGYFVAINPNNPDLNVDPDMFGNTSLDHIVYAIDDLVHITNPLQYMPKSVVSFSITPYWALASGASDNVILTVSVPYDQYEGEYTTWVRLLDTLTAPTWVGDSFQLRVIVGPNEDIDIVENDISGSGFPNDTLVFVNQFTVINPEMGWNPDPDGPANIDLYNIRFAAQNMLDTLHPTRIIPSEQVYIAVTGVFGPTPVSQASLGQLVLGDTAICEVWIRLPYGTKAATYKGQVQVQDDDGWPSDVVGVWFTVEQYYDLDISDNEQNLVGNTMTLTGIMGANPQGYFRLINPNTAELNYDPDVYGNEDFTGLSYAVDTLWYVPEGMEDISYYITPANVTVNLPVDLASGASADVLLSATIPSDVRAGRYRGRVSVTGTPGTPGTPTDWFFLELVIGGFDDLDIAEASVSAPIASMLTTATTSPFTVWSTDNSNNPDPDGPGNTTLYGVHFTVTDLTGPFGAVVIPAANVSFVPSTIDSIAPGTSVSVYAQVYIPVGAYNGTYTGLATAINNSGTTSDTVRINVTVAPYYDLDIADNQANLFANTMHLAGPMGDTRAGNFKMINPATDGQNVDPDIYGNADLSSFIASVDTLWYVPSGAEDINYFIPPSAVTIGLPLSTLYWGTDFDGTITVNIPYNIYTGVYRGTVTVTGYPNTPGTTTDQFTLQVSVGSVDDIDIAESSVNGAGDHGTTVNTYNFNVWSTDNVNNPDPDGPGNTTLYGVTFTAQDLKDASGNLIIPATNISFVPSLIDSMQPGTSATVYAQVYIPYGTYATVYSGLATAMNNTATTSDTVRIIITVDESYDYDISDNTGNLVENWMTLGGLPATTQTGYFMQINPNNADLNVDPDMFGNADLEELDWSMDVLTHTIDALAYIPTSYVSLSLTPPHTLLSGASEPITVTVNIPADQYAGEYTAWVRVLNGEPDDNGDPYVGDSFQLRVIVDPVEDVDIVENLISNTVNTADTLLYIGTYTVVNPDTSYNPDPDGPSNIDLDNLRFTCEHLRNYANPAQYINANQLYVAVPGQFGATPLNLAAINQLILGDAVSVQVWASVPRGTYAASYSGVMTVVDDDGIPSDIITVTINVNPYYDLDISDNEAGLVSNTMHLAGIMGSTHSAYFRMINPNNPNLNVDPDIYGNADFTSFIATVETLKYIPMGLPTDINYYIPPSAVTFTLPAGLVSGGSYSARAQVAIPMNTFAGVYRGMVTVTGTPGTPGTPTDQFMLEVTVGSLDDIDITEAYVTGASYHGMTANTDNFTVWSTDAANNPDPDGPGNTTLYGVTFAAQDLRYGNNVIPAENIQFVPSMIDSIKPGQPFSVYAKVNIPFGKLYGLYTGLATATNNTGTTSDTVRIRLNVYPMYDLDISDNEQGLVENTMHLAGIMGSTHSAYFLMINPNNAELNVDPDMFGNAPIGSFSITIDTLRYVPMGLPTDINYYIPPSAVSVTLPAPLNSGASYAAPLQVNIPMNTFAGVYRGLVTVTGNIGTGIGTPTDQFILEVTVGPLDDIDIIEATASGSGNHGTTVNTTNFHALSTDAANNPDPDGPGNTTLYGVTFSCEDLRHGNLVIPAANVQFVPSMIDSIKPGQQFTVYARVNIPYGTYATTYSGLATATNNTGTTSDTVRIIIGVFASYDLDISDNEAGLVSNTMHLAGIMGSTHSAHFRMINPNSVMLNVDPDQYGNADFTSFIATVETLHYIPMGLPTDINYYIPPSAVTVNLPAGLASGASYHSLVTVNIPMNTFAGVYRGMVTVTGTPGTPGTPTDMFMLEVSVGALDDIDIAEASVSATGGHGTTVNTTNFHVWSTDAANNPDPDGPGNTTLYGVTFTAQDLKDASGDLTIPAANITFVPSYFDSIAPGTYKTVYAMVNIPYGTYATTYTGLATAMNATGTTNDTVRIIVTVLPSYDYDISDNTANLVENWMTLSGLPGTTQDGYFIQINPNNPDLNVDPDMFGNYDLFGLDWSMDLLLHRTNPLAYIPISNVSLSLVPPHTLLSGASEPITVTVNIPEDQYAGEYTAWVRVLNDEYPRDNGDPYVGDSFELRVIVDPVEDVDIVENLITNTVNTADTLIYIGTYTVVNPDTSWNPDPDGPANIDLYNLRFTCEHLRDTLNPAQYINSNQIYVAVTGQFGATPISLAGITQLALGDMATVEVWASVPRGTYAASYRGAMTVVDDDGWPSDVIAIIINVNPYYDLDISDNEAGLVSNTMHLAGIMGSTHSAHFRMINPNSVTLNVDPDIFGNADFTSFTATVETLRYIPMGLPTDINYYIPPSAVTVNLPAGLASGASYHSLVTVNIPMNTFAGVYRGMVTVTGTPGTPGTPTDMFMLEVSVGALDDIDITEASVSATGNHGTTVNTTNFTVWSTDAANNPDPDGPGNTTLYGVTFSSQDLKDASGNLTIPAANISFVPSYIDSIRPGTSKTIYARVNIPYGTYATTYTGLATAMNATGTTNDTVRIIITVNPYYDLDISDNEANLSANKMRLAGPMGAIRTAYFRMVNPNSAELNVDPDQYGNADFTGFTASVETLRYVVQGAEDILYYIPPSAISFVLPEGLASGEDYSARVQANIPTNTFNGIYRGLVTVTGTPGTPGTPTDQFMLEVVVGPLDDLDIDSISVHAAGAHGTTANATPFHVWSTDAANNPDPDGPGNTTLYGVSIMASDLRAGMRVIPAANVSFVPSFIDSIRPATFKTVIARVNIPYGTYATSYAGWAIASNATGTTRDSVNIIVTVAPYYDLDISDNEQNLNANKMTLAGPMGSLRTGFFRMVNPNSAELNVDPDQFGNANFISFTASVETLRYIPQGGEEILYFIPPSAVSITLPEGLASGAAYNSLVAVNIPANTFAGIYRGVVTITGTPGEPGTPSDEFMLEVVVGSLDDLDIDSVAVHATGAHGTMVTTTTFRVYSTDATYNPDPDGPGNTTLYGVTFITSDLRAGTRQIPAANVQMVPASFDSIRPGTFKTAYARVNIPYGTYATTYTGTAVAVNNTGTTNDTVLIMVTVNPYYDLDIADNQANLVSNKMNLAGPMGATRQAYFRMVNPNTPELNIDPDMYGNANFTSFTASVETLRYVAQGAEDILYYIPPSAVTFTLPEGLSSGADYSARVQVAIPTNTFAGVYRGMVTVTGTPGEPGTPTDMFVLEVAVGMLEDIDITQASVSAGGDMGTTVQTGNFTVWSTDAAHNPDPDGPGNVTLYGINFMASDLRAGNWVIPAANVSFVPTTIESLAPGYSGSVYARVNIPYGTYAATYSGLATAQNNSGSTSDTVRILVTVNGDYDLDIADNMANLVSNRMTLNLIPNQSASGQFLLVNPDRNENNYDPDPYGNSDLSGIHYQISEVLTSPDNYTLSGSAITFSNNPANLYWGASQYVTVTAAIERSQPYATYYGTVTVLDTVGEYTIICDAFTLEVVVGPLDAFSMPDTIFIRGYPGQFAQTGFEVTNTGNKTIERIEIFAMTDFFSSAGIRIPKSVLEFTPPILIDSMLISESESVCARVEIPRGALPTRYIAKAKAMQQRGDPAKNFVVVLDVGYRHLVDDGLVFSDNPVTGPYVDIGYIFEAGQPVKLTIMNMAAEIVHVKEFKEDATGVYRWYLTNDKGKEVAPGLYVVINECTLTIDEELTKQVFTKKLLIVK
jgi:uncharacterized membrane protein